MHNLPNEHSLLLTKWLGTTLCLLGIALTSFNIYPANILLSLIGSGLWAYAGYAQRDTPLLLVEGVAVFLYLAGFVTYVYNALRLWGIL